jgi:hypothetical protein
LSSHTPFLCRRRLLIVIIAVALAIAGTLTWSAVSARADGDPASDVLATELLFLPQDAGVPPAQQLQLGALLQSAGRSGFPIRVALIASPSDLGSITAVWRAPAEYADFLGEELSLTYRGLLLVIMPNGFGLYDHGGSVSHYRAAVAGVGLHPSGAGLGDTALTAIQRLAAAAGHPLTVPRAQAPPAAGSTDVAPWLVFAGGLVLIALAWAASVRARPFRQPRSA